MTADEIRQDSNDGLPEEHWLREIAAQLAELNHALKGKPRPIFEQVFGKSHER
jgi:hypothetical protein